MVGAFFEPHAQLVLFSFFEDDLSSVVHFISSTRKKKRKRKMLSVVGGGAKGNERGSEIGGEESDVGWCKGK